MIQAEKQIAEYLKKVDDSKGYQLQILRKEDNALVDISTLAGNIQHNTSMLDNPEKLTFYVQKDRNEVLKTIRNGDMVIFKNNGYGLFKGYVFSVGTDATQVFKITAYNQTRYLKNEETILLKNLTVSQIFEKLCIEHKLNYKVITPIDYIPPAKIYQNKTLYSIMRECLSLAENDSAKKGTPVKYMIRDNFGVLELLSIENLKTNIVIGRESLLSSYQFETSIDKGTYTQIKVVKKTNKSKKENNPKNTQVYIQKDTPSQVQWGILQKVVEADENMNEAQATQLAQNWLKVTCRETKTLSLSALGLFGMNAGVGFRLQVPELSANLDMYILEATHNYQNRFHTMDLSVNANDLEVYFK